MNKAPIENTVGGWGGYVLRRVVHVSFAVVPFIYYPYGQTVAQFFHLSVQQLLLVLIGLGIITEALRLKLGWTLFGHRKHEIKTISSFSWGLVSICLVLLLSPGKQFAIPIIWSCAFVDPLLGELRRTQLNKTLIMLVGVLFVMGIWWIVSVWLGIAWQLALLMGPLIVGLEWPNLRWIDDNALMQLVPLLVILLLYS